MLIASKNKMILIVTLCFFLAGCGNEANQHRNTGLGMGAGIGGVSGGVLGYLMGGKEGAILGAALGGIGGAAVGAGIGKNMDAKSKRLREQAEMQLMQQPHMGQVVQWNNPQQNAYGQIMVQQACQAPSPSNAAVGCEWVQRREQITIDGKQETAVSWYYRPYGSRTWTKNNTGPSGANQMPQRQAYAQPQQPIYTPQPVYAQPVYPQAQAYVQPQHPTYVQPMYPQTQAYGYPRY